MKYKGDLKSYIESIRSCEDVNLLREKFLVYDNFPFFFYGDGDILFKVITNAFENSPTKEGLRDSWSYFKKTKDGRKKVFNYDLGTANLQVAKGVHTFYPKEENKINGLEHSMWVTFHCYNEKEMENVSQVKAIALAMAGFGDYILRNNFTVRLPHIDLNHISR